MKNWIFGCLAIALHTASTLQAATSNPNAIPKAKALLQYLESLSGKKMLSGQESMLGDGAYPSTRDKYVYQQTGKYPAIYTTDFVDGSVSQRPRVVSNAKTYAAKGSIIAIQNHMVQPDLANGAGFQAMNIPGSKYAKFPEILTPGSTLNAEFNKRLDELAGYFKELEAADIPVLWRPYHEMNGDFFWWSHQPRFKELWIYTHDYLTKTMQCNNLVWVFGVNWYGNSPATSKSSPYYYYPGHEYVDMLSVDVYTEYGHAYDKRVHDELRALGGGKPIAIAENGDMPDVTALRESQPYWVYWSTWWGFEAKNGNTSSLYQKNYGHADVLTQDEVVIPAVGLLAPRRSVPAQASRSLIFGRWEGRMGEGARVATVYGLTGKTVLTIRKEEGGNEGLRLGSGVYPLLSTPEAGPSAK